MPAYAIHPRPNVRRRRSGPNREEAGLTWTLAFSTFVASLSSFQYGFSLTLNVPVKDMVKWYNHVYYAQYTKHLLEDQAVKWIATGIGIMYLAAMLGSFVAVYVSDRFGRVRSFQVSDLVAICGAILLGNARQAASIEMIIIGKFLEGFSMGLLSVAVPLYLVEIAPFKMRSSIVAIHPLGITIGALVSPILGLFLGNYWKWHVLLGTFAIPSACQLLLSLCIPESPRYLHITKKEQDSSVKKILKRLRGPRSKHYIRDEIEQMSYEVDAENLITPVISWSCLKSINVRKALATAIFIQLAQSIFRIDAGMLFLIPFISNALPFTTLIFQICIAVACIILTMLAIGIIAKFGIRSIFLITVSCMTVCSSLLTLFMILYQHSHYVWPAYIGFILMALYKCFFTMGPGIVPWIISTEIFTQNTRSRALCLCLVSNWIGDIIIGLFFALFYRWVRSYIWLIYTLFLAAFLYAAFKVVPETKRKTFLDLARQFSTSYHESLVTL